MEKRIILAFVLSLLLVYFWGSLNPKQPYYIQNTTTNQSAQKTELLDLSQHIEGKRFIFSSDIFQIHFIEEKAAIEEVIFKNSRVDNLFLGNGFYIPKNIDFSIKKEEKDKIVFVASENNKDFEKEFLFSNTNNLLRLKFSILNSNTKTQNYNLILYLGKIDFKQRDVQFSEFLLASPDRIQSFNGHKEIFSQDFSFLAVKNKYYCLVVQPQKKDYKAFIKRLTAQSSVLGVEKSLSLPPGERVLEEFEVYIGPQNPEVLAKINPHWKNIVSFGSLDIIAQIFVQVLKFFYRITRNWGIALIFLTIAVQILLYPLSIKQARSMKKMQALQPEIEILRKKYADNPQKLNREILELYRQHNTNPLGGCLPFLLQMPIFIALYQVQNRLIYFKNANFLWIRDLSLPDNAIDLSRFGISFKINILPILMAILMFIQQKANLQKNSANINSQQKMLAYFIPLMLLIFFYNVSAAFNLYLLFTNLFMLFYQVQVNRAKE